MKITVVICTYNSERYIPQLLESILSQSRLPDEVVFSDDASTDSTLSIVDDFATDVPFKVHIQRNEHNLGIRKNWEQAISLATGDIIVFSDDDDVWFNNKLELMEQAFLESPEIGVVFSNAVVTDEALNPKGYDLWTSLKFTPSVQRLFLAGSTQALLILIKQPMTWGTTMAFRASFRDVVLPIGERWWHDGWVGTLVSLLSRPALIEKPLTKYRQREGSQVGARPMLTRQPLATVKSSLEANQHYYERKVKPWMEIRESLLKVENVPQRDALIKMLDSYIKHAETRLQLPNQMWKRFNKALIELLSFRYHRYARGFLSFAKDIIMHPNR